jgi:transcriptional regulator with XRE-family HTH domain
MGWTRRDFAATFERIVRDRYVEIGALVRQLREEQGLSQEALAARASVSVKTISRIETPPAKGHHEIRGGTFRKLADALGVTVAQLRAPLNRNGTITVAPSPMGLAEADAEAERLRREQPDDEGRGEGGRRSV